MSTHTLTVEKDIDFCYTDSGPIPDTDYTTLIIFHGHTFHGGVFRRLLSPASSHMLRVVNVNRREYPGSTPYSSEELQAVTNGSDAQRAQFLEQQGIILGHLIAGLIQQHELPQNPGIVVVGWSLGNVFTLAFTAAIASFPEDMKARLQAYVKGLILWDPPSQALGVTGPPGCYVPLWDMDIPVEERGAVFGRWCSSYFKHGNIRSRDFSEFNQRNPEPFKKPTIETMTQDELFSITDFVPGFRSETILTGPAFASVLAAQTKKILFDLDLHREWDGIHMWHIYGDANSWIVPYCSWVLEDSKTDTSSTIHTKVIKGANHFLMWEKPDEALNILKDCIQQVQDWSKK